MTDYLKYRGKCKEFCQELIGQNSDLTLVRGYYDCPFWGRQPHWWCVDSKGNVIDPTKNQFPSKGIGEYTEFDGNIECAKCGQMTTEEDATIYGNYAFCSGECVMAFVL